MHIYSGTGCSIVSANNKIYTVHLTMISVIKSVWDKLLGHFSTTFENLFEVWSFLECFVFLIYFMSTLKKQITRIKALLVLLLTFFIFLTNLLFICISTANKGNAGKYSFEYFPAFPHFTANPPCLLFSIQRKYQKPSWQFPSPLQLYHFQISGNSSLPPRACDNFSLLSFHY